MTESDSLALLRPVERDLRLDLFRGIGLWMIFLDHIPHDVVSWLTLRNYGFSDAAEFFVFISGYHAMTETVTTTSNARPKRNRAAHAPVLVTSPKLALHFGVARQRIDQLVQQGVIERRADGLFDQDVSRLKYLNHLRSEHRRSPRAAADAKHAEAKTAFADQDRGKAAHLGEA
jgi:hypothetical protein